MTERGNGGGGTFDASTLSGLTFEAAYTRLQAAVERLQEGNLPLDDALAAYEEGVALSRHCQTLLERAELRVQVLDRPSLDDEDTTDDAESDDWDDPPF